MDNTCSVCIEVFTKQPNKKQAKCPYCDIKACVKCTQTYLMNSNEDPHCMGCRRGWARDVMDTILLTTWVNGEYKKHRENILVDRERSRLPAAQIIIENQKKADEYEPERQKIYEQISELQRKLGTLHSRVESIQNIQATFRAGRDPFQTRNGAAAAAQERRVFVMPCPATNCRGFLSQSYKCGVCDIYVCPECREIKGTTKDAEHTCDPTTVETVRTIKKDTKPCPECGTGIFKIDGCDQMFCTNCNTPFSWKTGLKVTSGAIHNPHYFEFLRKTNGGVMPRQPGDIPCGANLPTAWTFDREISRKYYREKESVRISSLLYQALNTLTHIQHYEIPNLTNGAEDQDTTEYNVRYLRNEITETRWKQLLQQREKRRMRRDEIRQRFEAFVGVGVDIYSSMMRELAQQSPPPTEEKAKQVITNAHNQLLEMINIFNTSMMEISKRYKCRVMKIDETNMRRGFIKYTTGRTRKSQNSSEDGSDSEDETKSESKTNILVRA
jgi:hypothetical protein